MKEFKNRVAIESSVLLDCMEGSVDELKVLEGRGVVAIVNVAFRVVVKSM